jgi:fumarylacetoacetase
MQVDFSLKSWVKVTRESDFPIQNIPFGIGLFPSGSRVVCTRIGDQVVDLVAMFDAGLLPVAGLTRVVLNIEYLNAFIALGKEITSGVRAAIVEILQEEAGTATRDVMNNCMHHVSKVQMCLPVDIGDYTDFYSSREHATNVGTMFRDPDNALLPNWLHMPVAYHGRASSIVVSGTPVKRPHGQTMPAGAEVPVYGPSKLMDFELEMGFVIGKDSRLGEQITTANADDYIFGLALFNDWSARDIQKWEYVPLGPFLGKNFASTISPWIVTLEALEPFRVEGLEQDTKVLSYLQYEGTKNFDIRLQVSIQTEKGAEKIVSESNFKYMYWNMCQQLAHHTVNGCNVRVGDFNASGTISGKDPSSYGSMLELSWRGTKPIQMPDGTERKFIHDGDTVILRGWGEKEGVRIGFGEATGKLVSE